MQHAVRTATPTRTRQTSVPLFLSLLLCMVVLVARGRCFRATVQAKPGPVFAVILVTLEKETTIFSKLIDNVRQQRSIVYCHIFIMIIDASSILHNIASTSATSRVAIPHIRIFRRAFQSV